MAGSGHRQKNLEIREGLEWVDFVEKVGRQNQNVHEKRIVFRFAGGIGFHATLVCVFPTNLSFQIAVRTFSTE
jgi:hypothetical protein